MIIYVSIYLVIISRIAELCYSLDECCSRMKKSDLFCSCSAYKTVLYDVNLAEGFNLRRDVYIRLAVWINQMQGQQRRVDLILPPWNQLYHWQSKDIGMQKYIPWSLFFDIPSFKEYIPVMEMSEFFSENNDKPLDYIIILQHYEDIWTDGFVWENKWSFEKCSKPHNYIEVDENLFMGYVLGYSNITSSNVKCVSFQGPASMLTEIIDDLEPRTILFEHAEVVLHDFFGQKEYWDCRKSMKFSPLLIAEAKDFMYRELNLSVHLNKEFSMSNNKQFPYMCVHLRRKDFVKAYPDEVPSLKWAAYQIKLKLEESNVTQVFVATDAPMEEFNELKTDLTDYSVLNYKPAYKIHLKYKDGGISIIEQIVCSHARYFIGTHHSTFSYRIQEEREILGFDSSTTFNRLCGNNNLQCSQPTKWLISN